MDMRSFSFLFLLAKSLEMRPGFATAEPQLFMRFAERFQRTFAG